MERIECLECGSYRYCTMDSCIYDLDESEEFYRNQEIVEGLKWIKRI